MAVCERLWSSVILQAIADVEEGLRIEYYEKHNKKKLSQSSIQKREEILAYAKEARDWLDSKVNELGSFVWVCDMGGFDANKLWEMTLTREGRSHFLKKDRLSKEIEEECDDV